MATSSFNKEFSLNSSNALNSLNKAFDNAKKINTVKATTSLSSDDIKRGEEKLKKILSR